LIVHAPDAGRHVEQYEVRQLQRRAQRDSERRTVRSELAHNEQDAQMCVRILAWVISVVWFIMSRLSRSCPGTRKAREIERA
jgi:hypothetical protein